MTTRLLLIRHGETNATATDKFSGDDNVHLTDAGREQVTALARRLASQKISAVYTSPLDRALETATILSAPHGLQPIAIDGLREISHGHWEGLTVDEVRSRFGAEHAAWEADPFHLAPSGGDSGQQVLARALPVFQEIVRQHPEGCSVIVSHKGTLRLVICSFLGIDSQTYRDRLDLSPASLTILDFQDPTRARLLLFNDVSHYASA